MQVSGVITTPTPASESALLHSQKAARGCYVELIMKDIATVRRQPKRLKEWAQIAMEEAEAFML